MAQLAGLAISGWDDLELAVATFSVASMPLKAIRVASLMLGVRFVMRYLGRKLFVPDSSAPSNQLWRVLGTIMWVISAIKPPPFVPSLADLGDNGQVQDA